MFSLIDARREMDEIEVLLAAKTTTSHADYRRRPVDYAREVLKIEPWSTQIEIAEALLEPPYMVSAASANNQGKCVAVDELLTLADGRRIRAGDLVGQPFTVLSLVGGNAQPFAAHAAWNATETVYRVTTESGKTIVRNAAHPLWCANGVFANGKTPQITPLGWTGTATIRPGQLIAAAEKLPAFGRGRMKDAAIKVLAYLIGDGGITTDSITFSQQDNCQLADFRAACETLGASVVKRRHGLYDYAVTGLRCSAKITSASRSPSGVTPHRRNPVLDLLREHGMARKHSRAKFIPAAIFSLSRRRVRLFLSRLYATDGWANVSRANAEIGFCSTSSQLCRDLQDLLIRFGVQAILRRRHTVDAWVLTITSAGDVVRFCDRIGIFGKEKAVAAARTQAANCRAGKRWRTYNAVPGTRWERVVSVERLPACQTVAIEVPGVHTYLTHFWEHNTHTAAWLINWFYDSYPENSGVLTTAPSNEHIRAVLWGEVRTMRARVGLPGFETRAVAPLLQTSPTHYAKGIATDRGERLKGRHLEYMLFVIDEAVGVKSWVYDAIRTMFQANGKHFWLIIGNPTDPSSTMYAEELKVDLRGNPLWKRINISAVNHPNVLEGLHNRGRELCGEAGRPLPIPGAVTLEQFESWIASGADKIPADERDATDLQWPPEWYRVEYTPGEPPQWFRPGMELEASGLGRWPQAGSNGVWSEAAWQAALHEQDIPRNTLAVIGCDVAHKGMDKTVIVVRVGPCVVHYEEHQGWDGPRIVGRLKELAVAWAQHANEQRTPGLPPILPRQIRVKVEADGMGAMGVVDWANPCWRDDFNFVGISAGGQAVDVDRYVNCRSEMWFEGVVRARTNRMDLSRLPKAVLQKLRLQAMAPLWGFAGARRSVEPKKDMKKRLPSLGSPDGMDAINICFCPTTDAGPTYIRPEEAPPESRAEKRGLFGRGR